MTIDSTLTLLTLFLVAILAAGGIVAGLTHLYRPRPPSARHLIRTAEAQTVFLFDDGTLVDATPPARRLLRAIDRQGSDLDGLTAILARRFPDLRNQLGTLSGNAAMRMPDPVGGGEVALEYWDGLLRITLDDAAVGTAPIGNLAIAALQDEVGALRAIAEDAPQLIWKQDDRGQITWANRAYLALVDLAHPVPEDVDPLWPPALVFGDMGPVPSAENAVVRRHAVALPGEQTSRWFEVSSVRRGTDTMHFGIDASGIVQAEIAQKTFVQTLTKTFANLSIGLAIFDKERRLALFNPALLDLTGLPASFLSARPMVHSVLDRLRDNYMLPEPKNYSSWRDQVAALEAAASQGTYCDTWSLPSGQTYRVTGRPHPDGAIAFLFEDISAEVSLTRSFRSELDTAQAVLDTLGEAIAVFTPAGTLSMSNAAYTSQWGGTADMLDTADLSDELRRWQTRCAPTPVWDDLRALVSGFGTRSEWTGTLRLHDGRALACRFVPLSGGSTLVGFRNPQEEELRVPTSAERQLADLPSIAVEAPARPRRARNKVLSASA